MELGQNARVGDTLITLEGINASEVEAMFQMPELGNMLNTVVDPDRVESFVANNSLDTFEIVKSMGLTATVRLASGQLFFEWPAELVRSTGEIDAETGAIGFVVRVENPTVPNPQQPRPPLDSGSFVEVILQAPRVDDALLVPREAIRGGAGEPYFVYINDADGRLARQEVEVGSIIDDRFVIEGGLDVGDVVLLSDPRPAVVGLKLEPQFSEGN